jgi:hypothetical protein
MEGRIGGLVVAIIFLVGVGLGQFYWNLGRNRRELAELQVLLAQARGTLASKEEAARARRHALEIDRAVSDEYKVIAEEHGKLSKEVADLEAQYAAIQHKFIEAVTQVRAAAPDLPPADVLLKDGVVLKDATVQRMSDQDITFQHSGGISKVEIKNLPPEIRERFRHQMPPLTANNVQDPSTPEPKPKKKR